MKHAIHGKTRTARRKALDEIYDNNIPRLTSIEESNEIYAIRSILKISTLNFFKKKHLIHGFRRQVHALVVLPLL